VLPKRCFASPAEIEELRQVLDSHPPHPLALSPGARASQAVLRIAVILSALLVAVLFFFLLGDR
jgi:hypothetical protein